MQIISKLDSCKSRTIGWLGRKAEAEKAKILEIKGDYEVADDIYCRCLIIGKNLTAENVTCYQGPCIIGGDCTVNTISTFGKPIYCGGKFTGSVQDGGKVHENFTEWDSVFAK